MKDGFDQMGKQLVATMKELCFMIIPDDSSVKITKKSEAGSIEPAPDDVWSKSDLFGLSVQGDDLVVGVELRCSVVNFHLSTDDDLVTKCYLVLGGELGTTEP